MKTVFLLTIALALNIQLMAQQTFVPDDNFEHFLETHDANMNTVPVGDPNSLGNGIDNDNFVLTSRINTITGLYIQEQGISDLTGIEDFTAIKFFRFSDNQVTQLDISQNTDLMIINCNNNLITQIDVSQNPNLLNLYCSGNQLTQLNLTQNPNLTKLECKNNQLTEIDLRNIDGLGLPNNHFITTGNPDLTCIYVDDADWATQQWSNIDPWTQFVETQAECLALAVDEPVNNIFDLYPNPVGDRLYITGATEGYLIIYTPGGKVLIKQYLNAGNNEINLSKTDKGLYIAEIHSGNHIYYEKIIKK